MFRSLLVVVVFNQVGMENKSNTNKRSRRLRQGANNQTREIRKDRGSSRSLKNHAVDLDRRSRSRTMGVLRSVSQDNRDVSKSIEWWGEDNSDSAEVSELLSNNG